MQPVTFLCFAQASSSRHRPDIVKTEVTFVMCVTESNMKNGWIFQSDQRQIWYILHPLLVRLHCWSHLKFGRLYCNLNKGYQRCTHELSCSKTKGIKDNPEILEYPKAAAQNSPLNLKFGLSLSCRPVVCIRYLRVTSSLLASVHIFEQGKAVVEGHFRWALMHSR